MQHIPYTSLDEIERDRAEMQAFRKEIEDLATEEAEEAVGPATVVQEQEYDPTGWWRYS